MRIRGPQSEDHRQILTCETLLEWWNYAKSQLALQIPVEKEK